MTNNGQTKGNDGEQGATPPETTPTAEQVEKQEAEMHAAECRRALEKARVPATRNKMAVEDLRLACEGAILPIDGTKAELIERLGGPKARKADAKKKAAKKYITKKWVEGKTVCAYCHAKVRVIKVETDTDEGKVIRTRTLQCNSTHRHTYKLAEVTAPDA